MLPPNQASPASRESRERRLQVDRIIRERCNEDLDIIRKRLEQTSLLGMTGIIAGATGSTLAELHLIINLLTHFIDTEYKLATGMIGNDYVDVWMNDARQRIKRNMVER